MSEKGGPQKSAKHVDLPDPVGEEGKGETNCWSHPHISKPVNYPTDREHPNYGLRRITQQDCSKLRFHRESLAYGSHWPPRKWAIWQKLWQDKNLMVRPADERHAGDGLYVQTQVERLPEGMTVGMYSGHLVTKLPTTNLHSAVQMLCNKKWVALTMDQAIAYHYLCKANFYIWGSETEITRCVNIEIMNG